MCGIFLSISRHGYISPSSELKDLLAHRGPDSQNELRHKHCSSDERDEGVYLTCMGSVLSLRGSQVVEQPIQQTSPDGELSFLCWNGEAWSFAGQNLKVNDSEHVFSALSHAISAAHGVAAADPGTALVEALSAYTGPYAFVFYDETSRRIHFGRDFLGRRSLMWRTDEVGSLLISSVTDSSGEWRELDSDGIYSVDLTMHATFQLCKALYGTASDHCGKSPFLQGPCRLVLQEDPSVNDAELLTRPDTLSSSVHTLHQLLLQALFPRLLTIPQRLNPVNGTKAVQDACVAVLFSGGVDCSVLARLSSDVLDASVPIDLLNVAFENPRAHATAIKMQESPYKLCPDRITAHSSLSALRLACPDRLWRLVTIDIPYTEFLEHRSNVIRLMRPHDTEMDLSIAAALYFAARGTGTLENGSTYCTSARVLLSGLGADELFAGYTRHATAFTRGGLRGLHDELALDISRLGQRNLGRDDRVTSHWAKEVRYPFLDEQLVRWALSAPLRDKCGFGVPPVVDEDGKTIDPAKMVLRRLALSLGLRHVAHEKKRAVSLCPLLNCALSDADRYNSERVLRKWRCARQKAQRR